MRICRNEIRAHHGNCSAEELDRILQAGDLDSAFMVAYHCNDKPFLHTFRFRRGTVETSKSHYKSTGVGAPMANYLLSELAEPKMDYRHAEAVAVHVVD